jgi:hypothetical protein
VKLILMTDTAHHETLTAFVNYVRNSVTQMKRPARRLYTHVPASDSVLVRAFQASGFFSEGILEKPYNSHSDFIVFGRDAD